MASVDVLEYQVLSTIRDKIEYKKHANVLTEDLFTSEETRYLFKTIIKQHNSNSNSGFLSIQSLSALVGNITEEGKQDTIKRVIQKIKKYTVKNTDVKETLIKRFIQRRYLTATGLEIINQLGEDDPNFEIIEQTLTKAKCLVSSSFNDIGIDYFKGYWKRIEELEASDENRLPTGLSSHIDRAIRGGLGAGEVGVLIAPTAVGKSLCLINVTHTALSQGKQVLYATLELHAKEVERRLHICNLGRTWEEIRENKSMVQRGIRALRSTGAALRIADYTSSLCSVGDIKAYIERAKDRAFRPDILIVDHVDLMYSPKQYKELRHELSSIMAGLRRLGSEYDIPVWTASQANREALKQGKTRLHNIAEDIGKAQAVDVAITMSQTPEEKEDGIMHLHLEKNRIGKGNPQRLMSVDYDILKVRDVNDKKMKDLANDL